MSHPTASTILEFSIVVTQTKTITHEEKTSGMLGTWKHMEIIFKVVVMSSVLKNLVMTTLKLYSQQILTLIEIFLKIQKIILQFEYRVTDSHWYNYK